MCCINDQVYEIPVSEIKQYAVEYGLPSATVNELMDLGEPVYIATGGIKIEKHPIRVIRTNLSSYENEFGRGESNE